MEQSHLILIGGRSGVGKTTVASVLHTLLIELDVKHAYIEGDLLDLAHPAPWKEQLAERNLALMWANYRELGFRRLIYTNTVSILEVSALTAAMGDSPSVTSVLLRASDETAAERLSQREFGTSLELHLNRSATAATRLDIEAPDTVHRIPTDGRTPSTIAQQILDLSGWGSNHETGLIRSRGAPSSTK